MNQFAQSAFVAAVSHSFSEWRIQPSAQSALGFALHPGNRVGSCQPLAAHRAGSTRDRTHGRQAFLTNGKTGNIYEGGTTKTTIGGKERCEKTLGDATRPRDERTFLR